MNDIKITQKPIADLIPYSRNPRKNDEAVPMVMNSIKEFGFKVPIVVDKNNIIVCGHTRFKAALKLGLETVPCIVADDLSDEQIKAFRLADNKVSEKAEWDFHNENDGKKGAARLTDKERRMVDKVKEFWLNRKKGK